MANEYYELDCGINAGGQYALLTFHYRIANPTDPDEYQVAQDFLVQLAAGAPGTSWLTRLSQCMSDQAFISSIQARRVAPSGGNTAGQLFSSADYPGTRASPIHTQQIAGCMIWVADGTPGKSGRNFLPGVPESALEGSRWTAAYDGWTATWGGKHLTGESIGAGIMLPCIYDRVAKTGWIPDNGYLSPLVGTQRRREVPV